MVPFLAPPVKQGGRLGISEMVTDERPVFARCEFGRDSPATNLVTALSVPRLGRRQSVGALAQLIASQ